MHLYPAVFDASGQPVSDLTARDFSVVDNGKPQSVWFFRKPVAAGASPLSEFSNRKGARQADRIAILFDLLNQSQEDYQETWHALSKSLPQLESGDSVYCYLLNLEGELVPIHGVGAKAADDATWPRSLPAALDKAMKTAAHGRPSRMGPEDQVKKTFHQLEVLATAMAAVPGRRNILWITDSVQSVYNPKVPCTGDWVDCGLYVPHLAVTLAHDGVAVNVVSYDKDLSMKDYPDPGKWEDKWTPPPFVDTANAAMHDLGYLNAQSAQGGSGANGRSGGRGSGAALNLAQMALLTGGGIYFRQDIRAILERVRARDANAFEIAYDPSAANWDNKFHRVRVTCNRKGVRVQSRERYYALPDARTAAERMKAALMMALQSQGDDPAIGLRATRAPLPGGGHGVHLEMRASLSDVLIREEGGKFQGSFYVLISDRGAAGPLGEPTVLELNPALTAEQYQTAMEHGLPLVRDHPTGDAVHDIRLIILDRNTNAVGSITIPVK
jgi:VWFA-related protein